MILREMTIKQFGYDPLTLTKGSHKRVCISCDQCGEIRDIEYRTYTNLCHLCANREKLRNRLPKPKFIPESERFLNNTQIDRILTIEKFGYDPIDLKEKSIRKVRAICEKCNIGRIVKFQQYRNLCFNCSRIKNNKNMNIINKLSFNYLIGGDI